MDDQMFHGKCANCGTEIEYHFVKLCDTCMNEIAPPRDYFCEVCGVKTSGGIMTRWNDEIGGYQDAEGNWNPPRYFCEDHMHPNIASLNSLVQELNLEDDGSTEVV